MKKRAPRGVELKNADQIRTMRRAGLVVAAILDATSSAAKPGVTTQQLDDLARAMIAEAGAVSSFLDYDVGYGVPPYPAVQCISVNEEVVHGIPGDRVLHDGDVVSIDFGVSIDGFHADSAVTTIVGEADPADQALSDVTRNAMWHGIAAARLGGRVTDISHAVESYVRAQPGGYGIVSDYTGHGIGSAMHQPPDVPNLGRPGRGPAIVRGMCLAVEPMVTRGRAATAVLGDDWTVVTRDSSRACHWEHTMTVTADGIWVLTAADGGEAMLTELGVGFGPLAD